MRTLKIGLSCFLGGFIGGIVAFSVNPLIWWLGIFIGGLVGYISYDFKNFIECVVKAAHMVVTNWPERKAIFEIAKCMLFLIWLFGPFFLIAVWKPIFGFLLLTSLFGFIEWARDGSENEFPSELKLFLLINIFGLTLWYFPRLILLVVLPAFLRFFKYLYFLVHSEERLICGVDAAIGVFIGYQFGHPIACGMAAAIAGVINYELLSKRLLRNALVQFKSN